MTMWWEFYLNRLCSSGRFFSPRCSWTSDLCELWQVFLKQIEHSLNAMRHWQCVRMGSTDLGLQIHSNSTTTQTKPRLFFYKRSKISDLFSTFYTWPCAENTKFHFKKHHEIRTCRHAEGELQTLPFKTHPHIRCTPFSPWKISSYKIGTPLETYPQIRRTTIFEVIFWAKKACFYTGNYGSTDLGYRRSRCAGARGRWPWTVRAGSCPSCRPARGSGSRTATRSRGSPTPATAASTSRYLQRNTTKVTSYHPHIQTNKLSLLCCNILFVKVLQNKPFALVLRIVSFKSHVCFFLMVSFCLFSFLLSGQHMSFP